MGLDDPEDLIPGLIIIVAALGFIGGLADYISEINSIPVLSNISLLVHSGFTVLGDLLTPYLNFSASVIGMGLEVLTIIISILIIVKVGY